MSNDGAHVLIRLSISDDIGYATNILEDSRHENIVILDPHSEEFPNKDDKTRFFITEPVPSQSWRRVVSDPAEREKRYEALKNAKSVTVLLGISGNQSRLRETTFNYLLAELSDPDELNIPPEKINVVFQRIPHDREDKQHFYPDGIPVYNFQNFKHFIRGLSEKVGSIYVPPLHSNEAVEILKRFFNETAGKHHHMFEVERILANSIVEDRKEGIEAGNYVVVSPDGANKIKIHKSRSQDNEYRAEIPASIIRGVMLRNKLYPDQYYDVEEDMLAQAESILAGNLPVFNDLYFDALPKVRLGDDKVKIAGSKKDSDKLSQIKEKVEGKRAILPDDTTDTGNTYLSAAKILHYLGANEVDVSVIYPTLAKYAQTVTSDTVTDDKGRRAQYTNAMKRLLTEKIEDDKPLIRDVYTLRTIRNVVKRSAAILGGKEKDEAKRFHITSIADFITMAILHSIDRAEGRRRRSLKEIPSYHMTTNGGGKMHHQLVFSDGIALRDDGFKGRVLTTSDHHDDKKEDNAVPQLGLDI